MGLGHALAPQPVVGCAAFREFVTRFEQMPGADSDAVVINEHEIRDGRIAAWREYLEPALFARS